MILILWYSGGKSIMLNIFSLEIITVLLSAVLLLVLTGSKKNSAVCHTAKSE